MSNLTGPRMLTGALLLILAVTTSNVVTAQVVEPAAPPVAKGIPDYIIGVEDMLRIVVPRTPEYSAEVPVRPDGKITTPLVEDMQAKGKSPSQLARDIEQVLTKYVRSPQVSVLVLNARSSSSQVKVMGQVKTQLPIPYREGLRVSDVVLAAGGLTEFAAPNKAMIKRTVDGKETTIRVRLGDLFDKGKTKEDIELKPGDVLIVPESWL
jgi:polysaccharide export outer membrane protein